MRSFRSGFWGLIRLGPGADGQEIELRLRATLDDGEQIDAELGRILVAGTAAEPVTVPAPEPAAGPLVAVCMATFDPPPRLFERQLDSIRAQTHRNWICVISDDCSSPERFEAILEAVGGRPAFRGLALAEAAALLPQLRTRADARPVDADYVAMADQDDFWHPDKLETLLAEIGGAQLVYSDARIIDRERRG